MGAGALWTYHDPVTFDNDLDLSPELRVVEELVRQAESRDFVDPQERLSHG
jgi:hypothetical protein